MTITYEILNDQVLVILKQLERLQLLRVKQEEKTDASLKTKRRWAGSISREDGKLFLQHVETMRNEGDRILD